MMKAIKISFLLILLSFAHGCTDLDAALLRAYKNIENNENVIEVRIYKNRNSERTIIIDIMKLANNGNTFLEYLYSSIYSYKNGKFDIRAYISEDYKNNTYAMYDGNQKLLSKREFSIEDIEANRIEKIEKHKRDIYLEDRYLLPFLGMKYLNKLSKSENSNSYNGNELFVKGISSQLILFKPIVANIEINESRIIEKYSDYYGNKVTRVLKVANISNYDSSELENYSNKVLKTINAWFQE